MVLKSSKFILISLSVFLGSCSNNSESEKSTPAEETNSTINEQAASLIYYAESNFASLEQLTFGGDNAEAYFSFADDKLVFQSNNAAWGVECDQIFIMDDLSKGSAAGKPNMLSTGLGRTTCSYFLPGDSLIVYASTHLAGDNCPPEPERTAGRYVWPVYNSFDIFVANLKGEIVAQLTDAPGYDAEATISRQGDKIVFTSDRSGDLELYTMNIDGSNVKQITDELGYDGGAFFSPDGTKLLFRASRPKSEEEVAKYKGLLADGLVEPGEMELFVCNVDGSELKQVTNLGKANWAPYYHPDGQHIIFSSNHASEKGFQFNLFMINEDGTGLRQITHDPVFDAFPMFSNDGKHLVFSSNRNNGGTRDTNVFLAEWKDSE